MNRFFSKATAVATFSFLAVAGTATTAQAQDRLNFNGSARVADQPGNPTNLLIDFLLGVPEPTQAGTPTGNVFAVPTISGAFMPGIQPGTVGVIQDLVVSPTGIVSLPINNFLVMGGYTFTLNSAPAGNTFGPISLVDVGTGTNAFFGVSGTVTGGNFGNTPRNYQGVFTAQFAGLTPAQVFNTINTGGAFPVAFSAEFVVASVVPEPSTYALMATGLGMLGFFARRRRTQV
jgi:hypothetical protein